MHADLWIEMKTTNQIWKKRRKQYIQQKLGPRPTLQWFRLTFINIGLSFTNAG